MMSGRYGPATVYIKNTMATRLIIHPTALLVISSSSTMMMPPTIRSRVDKGLTIVCLTAMSWYL